MPLRRVASILTTLSLVHFVVAGSGLVCREHSRAHADHGHSAHAQHPGHTHDGDHAPSRAPSSDNACCQAAHTCSSVFAKIVEHLNIMPGAEFNPGTAGINAGLNAPAFPPDPPPPRV